MNFGPQTASNWTAILPSLCKFCFLCVVPQEKMGPRNFYTCSLYRRRRHVMANIVWTKYDIDYRTRALESTKGLLHCLKIYELWSINGLKRDCTFYPPHYFVPSQSIAHPLIGINVAPHSDSKWNGIGFVCSSDSKPHQMLSCNCLLRSQCFVYVVSQLLPWSFAVIANTDRALIAAVYLPSISFI